MAGRWSRERSRARAALEELGFTVRVHEAPLTPLRERSPVVARHSPAAGTELDEGTAVEVWGL